jgi:hypothetical protein
MPLKNVDSTWKTLIEAVAGEIHNDETASHPATNNAIDIAGVDEITLRVKTFTLGTETSIDLYPQVADDAGEYAYITDVGGTPFCFHLTGTTRLSRALPTLAVRGALFRVLPGSTGTAGNSVLQLDAMRHQDWQA